MKYFSNVKNLDEAKKAFIGFCKSMHPDVGGDHNEFVIMKGEWERIKSNPAVLNQARPTARDYSSMFTYGYTSPHEANYARQQANNTYKQSPPTYDFKAEKLKKEQDYLNKWLTKDIKEILNKYRGDISKVMVALVELDNLVIDHFRAIRYMLKLRAGSEYSYLQNYKDYKNKVKRETKYSFI